MNQNWFISHHHQQTSQHPNSVPGSLLLFSYPALAASPPLFGQQPPANHAAAPGLVCRGGFLFRDFKVPREPHDLNSNMHNPIRLWRHKAWPATGSAGNYTAYILDPGHTHDDQQTDSHTAQVSQSRRGFRNSTVCCMLNKRQKTCSIGNLAHGYINIGFKSSFCIKSSKCVREA